jgi:hypothetical protein
MPEFKPGDKVRITRYQSAAPVGAVVTVSFAGEDWVEYEYKLHGHTDGWVANLDAVELVRAEEITDPLVKEGEKTPGDDPVNHPPHYTFGKYEVLDVIEDWGVNYHLGNAIKYLARAGRKDPAKERQDLEKAVFYINRRIKQL